MLFVLLFLSVVVEELLAGVVFVDVKVFFDDVELDDDDALADVDELDEDAVFCGVPFESFIIPAKNSEYLADLSLG